MSNQLTDKDLPEYFVCWDALNEHIQLQDQLTDSLKKDCSVALEFLKDTLGTDFLKQAWKTCHPFRLHVLNEAPWTREWLIRFADELLVIRGYPGYGQLLWKLKRSSDWSEARSVMQVALKMRRAGLEPSFVQAVSQKRTPDLRVTDPSSGVSLNVEVTALHTSAPDKEADFAFNVVTNAMFLVQPRIGYSGCLLAPISPRRALELGRQVEAATKEAIATGHLVQVFEPGEILMAVGPFDSPELESWCTEHGMQVGFSGPPVGVGEARRVEGKIGSKIRRGQMPADQPGLLAVYSFWPPLHTGSPASVLARLGDCVAEAPNLVGCVVFSNIFTIAGVPASSEITQYGDHWVRTVTQDGVGNGYNMTILIANRACSHPVKSATWEKIKTSFLTP